MAASVRDVQNLQTTVVGLQGNPVSNAVPVVGDALVWDGSQWLPSAPPPPAPPLNGPIIGVTDGSNAAPGMVGEVISISSGPVTITSTTWTDVVTLNVTPGDWDVIGYVDNITAGFDAQATPPVDGGIGFALRVNNTWSPGPGYLGGRAAMVNQPGSGTFNNISTSIFAGPLRVNTAVTVTVTLTVSITLLRSVSGGSGSSNGNMIWARRAR